MGRAYMLVVLATIAATTALLLPQSHGFPDFFDDKVSTFHIGGKVLCQDCSKGWNEWIFGSPLKGCRVAVTCMDMRQRVVYHASDETDDQGAFEIIVNKNAVEGKVLQPELCIVRLVSSPHPNCNVATDFAGGKTGVAVGLPSMVYRDIVRYTLGPFYYTTPMCELPDTGNGFL